MPTNAELNWMVTWQVPEPATGVALQVSADFVNGAGAVKVTVGVTEPVPTLVAVKVCEIRVEIAVVAVHEVGDRDSGMVVSCPVTVAVAVAVEPPLTAVAVIVQVPFVEGAV